MQEPSPEPSPRKKSVVVNAGPFASFAERRIASAMQKYIVPWAIAIHGLSFAKRMTIDSVKEMLIAIIDEKELMPGHPNCAKEVAKYPLAFGDFARKVKAAAGISLLAFMFSISHIVLHGLTPCPRALRASPGQTPCHYEGSPGQTLREHRS